VTIIVGPSLSCSGSVGPTSGTEPLSVDFAASATGGYPPYSFRWDFGDGTSANWANGVHIYCSGTYTATLTVTDQKNSRCTKSYTIAVSELPPGTPKVILGKDRRFGGNIDNRFNYYGSECPINGSGPLYQYECHGSKFGEGMVWTESAGILLIGSHVESKAWAGHRFEVLAGCNGANSMSATVRFRLQYLFRMIRFPPFFGNACVTVKLYREVSTKSGDKSENTVTTIVDRCENSVLGTTDVTSDGPTTFSYPVTLTAGNTYRFYVEVYATSDSPPSPAANFDHVDGWNLDEGENRYRGVYLFYIDVDF